MAKKKKVPTFRRQNITDALLSLWQNFRRKNDAEAIREYILTKQRDLVPGYEKVYSVSTINNALAYGNVNSDELKNAISNFYLEREKSDILQAQKLSANVEEV